MKKSAIATALVLCIGNGAAHAVDMNNATFTMLDGTGGSVGVDTTVTGSIGGSAWAVSSTTTFFGQNWTTHGGTTFGPGTYSFDTIEGGVYTGVVVAPGQVGGHILFDWGVTSDIDVVNVWDVSTSGGVDTYTSTDGPAGNPPNPDGIRGYGMIDGAFPTFNANFDFTIAGSPIANADSKSTPPNTPVNIDLVANDSAAATTASPPDKVAVTPAAVPPASLAVDMTSTLGGTISQPSPPDGTVDYTPPAGVSGSTDTFTYTLTDDAGRTSSSATVSVALTDNDPPVASDTTVTTDEDTPLDILVDAVGSDPDGDPLTFATFDTGTANNATITADATSTVLTYSPAEDFHGTDSFTYSVTDGIDNSNVATITVIVNPVNDPLQCEDVDVGTATNSALDINVEDALLVTCTDIDGDKLSLVTVGNPEVPGATTSFDGANTVTYTPAKDYEGKDRFTYTATDGSVEDTKNVTVDVSGKVFGNFTMIDASGTTFGGTNDLVSEWDGTLNNTETSTNFNMKIASESEFPFFGFPWFAHHIRMFDPGKYEFDATCSVNQLESGIADCGGGPGDMLPLTIPTGMLGAHLLFDWNITENIDVVLLWERDDVFEGEAPGTLYQGPAGPTPPLDAVFRLASKDADGDGIPGAKMIDGPFIDFRANFNLDRTDDGGGEVETQISSIKDPGLGGSGAGCTLAGISSSPLRHADWLAVLGFLALLGCTGGRRPRKEHPQGAVRE